MKKALTLLLVLFLSPLFLWSANKHVSEFGALPDDGVDDTGALRKAVEYCKSYPGTSLIMDHGIYQLSDPKARQLENDITTGKLGTNTESTIFNPFFEYIIGLDFSGCKNTVIFGNGAIILCEGWMEPISIRNAQNITIDHLTIDYKRKPFLQGEVIRIEKDFFEVAFENNGRKPRTETPYHRLMFFDKKTHIVQHKDLYTPRHELREKNIVRFFESIPEELLHTITCASLSFHFRPAILILNSKSININNVTIHAQPGMGIVGTNSRDIILSKLSVIPSKGYYQSTNTDATHFTSCSGILRFDECLFQGQGDDATNVHVYYQTITRTTDPLKVIIIVEAPTYTHAQVLDAPSVGDTMELVDKKTLKILDHYIVTGIVEKPIDKQCEITLDREFKPTAETCLLANISKLPRLEFVNSTVLSHRARAVLVKTRNVLIENNTFKHSTGTAIHVGAESWWSEGVTSANVIIRNNYMEGCGKGAGSQGGASGIAVLIEAENPYGQLLHHNILIEKNTIIGERNACGIYISNTQDIKLKSNKVINCMSEYLITDCDKVFINK